MQEFWVQGGEYLDAKSERLIDGSQLKSFGPFYSYHDARRELQALTLGAIAKARVRFRIVPVQAGGPYPVELAS